MLRNTERLNTILAEISCEALVATSPENVTYLSEYWPMSQWLRRGPQNYVVWPKQDKGDPCLIANGSLLDLAADERLSIEKIRRFGGYAGQTVPENKLNELEERQVSLAAIEDDGSAFSSLSSVIIEYGLDNARIAVDEYGILPSIYTKLSAKFPGAEFVPAYDILRRVRAVKTEEEILRLKAIAHITEDSVAAALAIAKPGVTELDLAAAFHTCTVQKGAVPVLGCIGSGRRSAMPNVQPTNKKLEKGDIIRFDVGGRYKHYRADIARIAVLGKPSDKISRYHRALQAGVERACEITRPGTKASKIFEVAMEAVQKVIPHYCRTHVGHGIGIDGYDAPNLSPASNEVIEEGMVLCIETPYYELGFGGLQVEDMFVVRSHGVESLMKTDSQLIVI